MNDYKGCMAKKDVQKLVRQLKLIKEHTKLAVEKIEPLLYKGPKHKPVVTERDLVEGLRRLKVSPGEAFRHVSNHIISRGEGNLRFNWKMIRFTLFVWERIAENEKGYLKPKIDTVRKVCNDERFKEHYYGYYPDIKFDYDREVKLLNKLIAEKPQQMLFREGYYKFHKTNKIVPQALLNQILLSKK